MVEVHLLQVSVYPIISLCVALLFDMATADIIEPTGNNSRYAFAKDIFRVILKDRVEENVIYSPASIQSCLTLAFMGAGGQTADELRSGIKLGAGDKTEIAKNYGDFLKSEFKSSNNDDAVTLKMANRVYVNKYLELDPKFNEIAKNYFGSQAEQVNFADSLGTTKQINAWVEQKTNNKIQNLLSSDAVNAETSAILVNAIYFKGKWKSPFLPKTTSKSNFHLSTNQKVQVDMMYQEDHFGYAELTDLDAKALELSYKNTDLSMLIILPNKVDGLKELEHKLSTVDLNVLSKQLKNDDVMVRLPKFEIEFDLDLKSPLQELGIKEIFTDNAKLSGLFIKAGNQKVSKVQHKAYLSVNEAGSEAAAATFLKIVPISFNFNQKSFNADHPFVFAIRNDKAVFFAGHVAKF